MSLVLVVMVGNTLRTLQGVGWLSITPIDVEFPLWMGTWLGIFPTWETLGGQLAAFAFVIGSYYAAEWVRKRHLRRALAKDRAAPEPVAPREPEREPALVGAEGNGRHPSANGTPNGNGARPQIDTTRTPKRLEIEREREAASRDER